VPRLAVRSIVLFASGIATAVLGLILWTAMQSSGTSGIGGALQGLGAALGAVFVLAGIGLAGLGALFHFWPNTVLARVQVSITLLYRSPSVIRPFR
jgi:hypothetical protein